MDAFIHVNSTIVSHWFYLLSEGGDGENDKGHCYDIAGIGIDKAAKIVYEAQKAHFENDDDFADARDAMIAAAIELFTAGSDEEIAVTNAWYAVGVGDKYPTIGLLTGPTSVCSSNTTYKLDVAEGTGTTITWSVSPASLFAVNSGTGKRAVLKAKNSSVFGEATLYFNASTECDGISSVQEIIWVGRPTMFGGLTNGDPLSYGSLTNNVCEDIWIQTALTLQGEASYTWQKMISSPSNVPWSQVGKNIKLNFWQPNQTATFRLTMNNDCTSRTFDFKFKANSCSDPCGETLSLVSSSNKYRVSPNPSSGGGVVYIVQPPAPCESTLSLSTNNKANSKKTGADIKSVNLRSKEGSLLNSYHYGKNKKEVEIDVSGYKTGVYILEISDGDYVERQQLVIE